MNVLDSALSAGSAGAIGQIASQFHINADQARCCWRCLPKVDLRGAIAEGVRHVCSGFACSLGWFQHSLSH